MLAFTDNFNVFCNYIEAKPQSHTPSHAQILIFTLEQDGAIIHARHPLTRHKNN